MMVTMDFHVHDVTICVVTNCDVAAYLKVMPGMN